MGRPAFAIQDTGYVEWLRPCWCRTTGIAVKGLNGCRFGEPHSSFVRPSLPNTVAPLLRCDAAGFPALLPEK